MFFMLLRFLPFPLAPSESDQIWFSVEQHETYLAWSSIKESQMCQRPVSIPKLYLDAAD